MNCFALLTDFGHKDSYVGSMKAIIASIIPNPVIIDINHEVPAGDIQRAANMLQFCYKTFPKGTYFICVVDPGVGSTRKAMALRIPNYTFIAPDNGLLSPILSETKKSHINIREISNPAFMAQNVSHTFHGRDIFAPAASYLAKGKPFGKIGEKLNQWVQLKACHPSIKNHSAEGKVVYIDIYGNAVTNIRQSDLKVGATYSIKVKGLNEDFGFKSCYADVPEHWPLALIGSTGRLEICVNGGNAALQYGLNVGDAVLVRWLS